MNYRFADRVASLKPSAIREILKSASDPNVISFTAGNPASEAIPVDQIRKITAEILKKEPIAALQYSITEGYPRLREVMKRHCQERLQSFEPGRDDLIITSGAQQAVELACKVLCNEGDVVLCEDPSFIGSLNSFRSYNVRLCGIPMQDDGIDIEKLEAAMRTQENIRFLYLIPNFQNPTGITMSGEKRRAVYELARRYGVLILEDNPYGDLRFSGTPELTLKSLDTEGLVLYCGSFSKILAPGMRVGYVSAPAEIISKMTVAKQTSDVHTNILAQMIACSFMEQTNLDEHFAGISSVYKHKCAHMLHAMEQSFDANVCYTKPQGGLFIWCTLPDSVNITEFCKKALEKGVAVVPGTAFSADEEQADVHSFRLNFSMPDDDAITKGIAILGKLARDMIKA